MRNTHAMARDLRAAIERSGYYPGLVTDAVHDALEGESALSFVVHHQQTFDPAMEFRRHVTVLVLSPTRLIMCHTDDHPPSDALPQPHATTTTEAVPLSSVRSVAVTRVVPDPENYVSSIPPKEVVLTIGWGTVSRIDLEPASCGDDNCDADHGYTGSMTAEDMSLRVSETADGADGVAAVLSFARALSQATLRTPE